MKYYCFNSDNQILESSRELKFASVISEVTYDELLGLTDKEQEVLVVGYYMVHCPAGYGGQVLHLLWIENQEAFNHLQQDGVVAGLIRVEQYYAVPKVVAESNKVEINF